MIKICSPLTNAASEWLAQEGYKNVQDLGGRITATYYFTPYMTAIVSDIDQYGYSSRWDYEFESDAVDALNEWDGKGEPVGWKRQSIL